MSWYTSSYIGVVTTDGKIYPVGPFDAEGHLVPVTSTSASFTLDEIGENKIFVSAEFITDELVRALVGSYEDSDITKNDLHISYINFSDLPTGSPLKRGYFLIDDVQKYENDSDYFEGFYEYLTPAAYAAKLQAEAAIGYPSPRKDIEGNEIPVYSAADYMPYAYIDTDSFEYYAERMRMASDLFSTYDIEKKYGKDAKKVILIDEG